MRVHFSYLEFQVCSNFGLLVSVALLISVDFASCHYVPLFRPLLYPLVLGSFIKATFLTTSASSGIPSSRGFEYFNCCVFKFTSSIEGCVSCNSSIFPIQTLDRAFISSNYLSHGISAHFFLGSPLFP